MLRIHVGLLALVLVAFGCKGKDQEDSTEESSAADGSDDPGETLSDEALIQLMGSLTPIRLGKEDAPAELTTARTMRFNCPGGHRGGLGIFGGLWFYACAISQASADVLFGQIDPYDGAAKSVEADSAEPTAPEDAPSGAGATDPESSLRLDGTSLCDQVLEKDESSFFAILCKLDQTQVTDAAYATSTGAVGVSFKDIASFDGSGSWTKSQVAYPIAARIWDGADVASLKPSYAVRLTDEKTSVVDMFMEISDRMAQIKLTSRVASTGANCAATLKPADCHEQTFEFYAGDNTSAQKGMTLTILADDKDKPTLRSIEGTWTLTEAQARRLMATTPDAQEPTLFEAGRKLYFRIVAKDDYVWGQLIIRGEDGEIIAGAGQGEDKGPVIAESAGHCMRLSDEEADLFDFKSCGDIDFPAIVAAMTKGEQAAEFVDSARDISGIDFTDTPAEDVRTAE